MNNGKESKNPSKNMKTLKGSNTKRVEHMFLQKEKWKRGTRKNERKQRKTEVERKTKT